MRLLLSRANAVVDAIFQTIEADAGAVPLDYISVENFAVEIFGLDGSIVAALPRLDANLVSEPDGSMELEIRTLSPGAGLPRDLVTVLRADAARDKLTLDLTVSEWSLEALIDRIAGQKNALEALGETGLPISGTLGLSASRDAGLKSVGWQFAFQEGVLPVGDLQYAFLGATIAGDLNVETQKLSVDFLNLESERLSGDLRIEADSFLDEFGGGEMSFRASSPRLRIDARPFFEVAWTVSNLDLSASLDLGAGKVDIASARFGYGDFNAIASGLYGWGDEYSGRDPDYTLQATVKIDGPVTEEDMLAFWPPDRGGVVREDVKDRFLAGTMENVSLRFDIRPGALANDTMRDDAMQINYEANGVSYRFLDDMPPAMNARVRGKLTGNGLTIDILDGQVASWQARQGQVRIDQFKPAGGRLQVTGQASGPIRDLMEVLQDSDLAIGREEGFDVNRLSGVGEGTINLSRRLGLPIGQDDMQFSVEGQFRDASLAKVFLDLDLSDAFGRIRVNNELLSITGSGDVEGTAVSFTQTDRLDTPPDTKDTRLTVTGAVTSETLNRFGFALRAFVSGEIPIVITAVGAGPDFGRVDIDFDLTPTRLDMLEFGLRKPPGEVAKAQLTYFAPTNARPARYSGFATGTDFDFRGDIRLFEDNRVDKIDLQRAFISSRFDVSGSVARDPVGGILVTVEGPFLDASDLFGNFGSMGGEGQLAGALSFEASVKRLKLGDGFDISNGTVSLDVRNGEIEQLTAAGDTSPGQSFLASISRNAAGGRSIDVRADDASFFLMALLDLDFIEGGRLRLTGTFGSEDDPTRMKLKLFDARLVDAPLFTQVLSLASLRGLADTLSGDGVLFTQVEVPLTIRDGRYTVSGGRASGPALGLTVNGFFELAGDRNIDLTGVLVPSFGINSALGGIPIIGDLFVSRDGEGVISLTYGIEGTLEQAQVSINPLSAVTPGVLRRIFEDPSDRELVERSAEPASPNEEPSVPPAPPAQPSPDQGP